MELDNKRKEEERRRTQEAFEMAAEKLRIAMGKETPKQKLGPEKPDWLKKKQDGEAPAEPEIANPDDKVKNERSSHFERPQKVASWIFLDAYFLCSKASDTPNHLYHDETLFRSIELRVVSFAKNHF